jgi:hypothetical protein
MPDDKWVDYTVELYSRTKQKMISLYGDKISMDSIRSVFEQVCSFDRGERAGQQRIDERKAKEESGAEKPTEKQLSYIKYLDGDPDKFKTKSEASAWIEKNR